VQVTGIGMAVSRMTAITWRVVSASLVTRALAKIPRGSRNTSPKNLTTRNRGVAASIGIAEKGKT